MTSTIRRTLSFIGVVSVITLGLTSQHSTAAPVNWTKLGGIAGIDLGSVSFDPKNPAVMFVGQSQAGGMIFKSADGGATFTGTKVGGVFEDFREIAVSPQNSNTVIAFSSAEFGSGAGAVYKSVNAGASWAALPKQPGATAGRGLVIDNTGKIIVLGDRLGGFYRSTNLGASWTNTINGDKARVRAIVKDPKNANTLWAAGIDFSVNHAVLWKSTNFGASWTETTITGIDTSNSKPFALAVLPSGKFAVSWSGFDSTIGQGVGGVLTSVDGKTWVAGTGLPSDFSTGISVIVDPTVSTTLYATTNIGGYPNGLYRSADSGLSWTSIGNVIGGSDAYYAGAARPALGKTQAAVFAGGGDLFHSVDPGKSWIRQDTGIAVGDVLSVADDLLTTNGIYANNFEGLYHSVDAGKTWTRISTWNGATATQAIAVDPVGTHNVYAVTTVGAWRSANGGKDWTPIAYPGNGSFAGILLADPTKSGRLYAPDTGNTIYRSVNFGATFVSNTIGNSGDYFTANPGIAIDPVTPTTLYAGLSSGVWKSVNSGATWTKTALPVTSGGPNAIAVLKGTTATLFAAVPQATGADTLEKSTDGGKIWKAVTSPFPNAQFSLIAAPAGQRLFAYSGTDVQQSLNSGTSWGSIDTAIQTSFTAAQVSVTSTKIYVADQPLAGGGAFVSTLAALQPVTPAHTAVKPAVRAAAASGPGMSRD